MLTVDVLQRSRRPRTLGEDVPLRARRTSTRTTNHASTCAEAAMDVSKNLMAVGDEDQSVYGFRGADINNSSTSSATSPAADGRARQNYCSTNGFLSAANAVISHNRERKEKRPAVRARRGRSGARRRGRGRARRGAVRRVRDRGTRRVRNVARRRSRSSTARTRQSRVLEDVLSPGCRPTR